MKLTCWQKTAAHWFVELRARNVTAGLDAKFRRWLARDARHEVDFERHELAWELAGELEADQEIAASIAEAEHAGIAPSRPLRRHTFVWSAAVAGALMFALGIGVYVYMHTAGEMYTTAVGEQRTVVLPDQSRMVMNTATRARVIYARGARVVELEQGEATFTVMRNPARPFEVHAHGGVARALGTEFNVLTSSSAVTVAVLSGTVEVIAAAATEEQRDSAVLARGQEVTYAQAKVSPVHPSDAARIQAWHSGRIAFEDVALGEALAEFNRYVRTPIVLQDASLEKLRVSGVFRIGETEALLKALHTAFGLRPVYRESRIEVGRREAV